MPQAFVSSQKVADVLVLGRRHALAGMHEDGAALAGPPRAVFDIFMTVDDQPRPGLPNRKCLHTSPFLENR